MLRKRLAMIAGFAISACSLMGAALTLDELAVKVTPDNEGREFSFSDKYAGFFYGMTNVDGWTEWNAGWNIRAKRIFNDYRIFADGKELRRAKARVSVYPNVLDKGASVEVVVDHDKAVATTVGAEGAKSASVTASADAAKATFLRKCKAALGDVRFAEPCYREDLKSMSRYFNPPLHYGSVE